MEKSNISYIRKKILSLKKKMKYLLDCPICKYIPESEHDDFLNKLQFKIRKFIKGDIIAIHGEVVEYLYLLIKGSVRAEMVSELGLTLHIEDITAPYPIAAVFLVAEKNIFPVDVTALDDVEIAIAKKELIIKQLAENQNFLHGFMMFNANRTLFLSERMRIFSQRSIKSKVAYYILQHSKENKFTFAMSLSNLAAYFSVARPSLSRAISEMKNQKIITYKNGSGSILNVEKLNDLII